MMSLKPRQIDFQETWANLKETVSGVVRLRAVGRAEWAARFSDVYALCVAQPAPLAPRLLAETRALLEAHVADVAASVRAAAPLHSCDPDDGLLQRYVTAWQEYSQGVQYLNSLYSYLNLQHIKRQKISDVEIIYGSAATVIGNDEDTRQLEVGELGLSIWERVLVRGLEEALSGRIVRALSDARARGPRASETNDTSTATSPVTVTTEGKTDDKSGDFLKVAVDSFVQMCAYQSRSPLSLYERVVLTPYVAAAGSAAAAAAANSLAAGVSVYMQDVLDGLSREMWVCARYLHPSSAATVRSTYEQASVCAHLPGLLSAAPGLLARAASSEPSEAASGKQDLSRLYRLVRALAPGPLVQAARAHVAAAAAAPTHTHRSPQGFVECVVSTHSKYSSLFAEVFCGEPAYSAALDQACAELCACAGAAELLHRYCDALLRRRAGASESETEARLGDAILVFKYIDDKDVFQKHYARALARRLIHQLSISMEQEEAMINRLKAACGYEFTNKLHRMFTDIAVSADLNAQFHQHLREKGLTLPTGFSMQVLQAGAWPLGGASGSVSGCAPALETSVALFEQFYRGAFSGRRLALLQPLCSCELRYYLTPGARPYLLTATAHQVSILTAFENVETLDAKELRGALQLHLDTWSRHLRPLLDTKLLIAHGDVESEECGGTLELNLAFSSKRARLRLTAAATHGNGSGSGMGSSGGNVSASTGGACDDDRKMYLQAALVRIMKQRKVLSHAELVAEATAAARGQFAPSVALVKKCIEALIDKQYLERTPGQLDTYCYLA